MTCESCAAAEQNPRTGLYHAGCKECSARMLAHSIGYMRSSQRGRFDPDYKAALLATFGEQWEPWHRRVREWARRIEAARVVL